MGEVWIIVHDWPGGASTVMAGEFFRSRLTASARAKGYRRMEGGKAGHDYHVVRLVAAGADLPAYRDAMTT